MRTFLCLALVAISSPLMAAQGLHPLGLLRSNPAVTAPGHKAVINAKSPRTLPPSVDHTSDMPPVGDQGGQGSCTAWATAYYYKSHQERVEHGWSLADSDHQFSPAFVYNQINWGGDYGSYFEDAFQLLCDEGCATTRLAPYFDGDCTSWPSAAAYDTGIAYRCQEWHWFEVSDDAGIAAVKQCLADGDNVVIGLECYPNYDDINTYDTCYCVADLSGSSRGGHANCVVGYDDAKATHDGPGAFRVVNSWGTGWGNHGYYWMSYAAMKSSPISYQTAYYASDRIGYRPVLKLHVQLAHPSRSALQLTAGIGDPGAPLWSHALYQNYNKGEHPFPDHPLVFDLTDGLAALDSSQGNTLFLRCADQSADGLSGNVVQLDARHVDWGTQAISLETPVAIPDDGSVSATMQLRYQNYTVAASPAGCDVRRGLTGNYTFSVAPLNGYNRPLGITATLAQPPAAGTIGLQFDRNHLVPPDSCTITASVDSLVPLGTYTVNLDAADPDWSLASRAQVRLLVTGAGQALCVGTGSATDALAGQRWPAVDVAPSLPLAIPANYQAVIVDSAGQPGDTSVLRRYVQDGGQLLLIGDAPERLCGGTNLGTIAPWLGAASLGHYQGRGINVISTDGCPFGTSIALGETLGVAANGDCWLGGRSAGSMQLARLGVVSTVTAGLFNGYGAGHVMWYYCGGGNSAASDALLVGFFNNLGVAQPAVSAAADRPARLTLAASPNPFSGACALSYQTASPGTADLRVYDMAGRLVKTLAATQSAGMHVVHWGGVDDEGRRVAAGVYFIRLQTGPQTVAKRIVLIR